MPPVYSRHRHNPEPPVAAGINQELAFIDAGIECCAPLVVAERPVVGQPQLVAALGEECLELVNIRTLKRTAQFSELTDPMGYALLDAVLVLGIEGRTLQQPIFVRCQAAKPLRFSDCLTTSCNALSYRS